jgi:NTE family protein
VLDARPRQDTLAFQVDLWNAEGNLPRDLSEAQVRKKEIQYSSRTRAATQQYKRAQKLRLAVAKLIKQLPEEEKSAWAQQSNHNGQVMESTLRTFRAGTISSILRGFKQRFNGRHSELKDTAIGVTGQHPDAATMGFDD